MFKNYKKTIKELAKSAVEISEKALGSNNGKAKKKMAIEYVVNHLPVPTLVKPFVSMLFSSFIDDAIEFAVKYMEEI